MKRFKRLSAIILAAALLFSLAIPSLAADPVGMITMKDPAGNVKIDSTYKAYRVVAWNMSKLGSDVVYTDMALTAAYKSTLINTLGGTLTAASTDAEVLDALSNVKDHLKMATLAVELSKVPGQTPYTAAAGVFTGLPYGYYLVMETENKANDGTVLSKPILVSVPSKTDGAVNVSVTVKTSTANVEKDIVLGEGPMTKTVKSAEKKIGDTVNFKLSATIPTYAANAENITYYITDTLSKGLTLDLSSVVVTGADGAVIPAASHYKASETVTAADTVLKIDFEYAAIKDAGPLTIAYRATLNEKASIGSIGNPNSVTLTYSNNPGVGGNTYTTPKKHTLVFTTGIQLTKVDEHGAPLAGATFGIFSDAACSNPIGFYTYKITTDAQGTHITTELEKNTTGQITTGDDGIASFTGLIAGEYFIKEITAPAGYNLLKAPISVTIGVTLPSAIITGNETAAWTVSGENFTESSGTFKSNVINTKGFQLPGTGGMGTTLFILGGGSLLILACGLLFLYRKKNRTTS
ncbi:MAG: SpaH/EbpB family LPXTG-anchored major pilin [Ruthenibacterium sp.]